MKTCRSPLWAILALGFGVSLAFATPAAAAAPTQQGGAAPRSAAAELGGLATPWRGGASLGSAQRRRNPRAAAGWQALSRALCLDVGG